MKFFLSQMEVSEEAICVGTLTLIRAAMSAHGERGQEVGQGLGAMGLSHICTPFISSLFISHYWVGQEITALGCFTFSILEHSPPSTLSPLSLNPESQLPPESEFQAVYLNPPKLSQRLNIKPSYTI